MSLAFFFKDSDSSVLCFLTLAFVFLLCSLYLSLPKSLENLHVSTRVKLASRSPAFLPYHTSFFFFNRYIIHPHWPVLYRPSLGVGDRSHQIDPERQPLLFNSIGAIAAATWEGNIDAPPEIRKASEMNSSSRPVGMTDQEADDLEDAKIIMKLNGAQLSTVFFVRARYYLLRAMLEPTLEVIQSLIFMALCENGIGRAVAADQFSSLACRMWVSLE